ncbi:MAG: hypothetical protein CM15mV33_890 [uncultured marine virus]|nr:MAG: hypothetical protein CM15mV33_890 [uncultured marine virus]
MLKEQLKKDLKAAEKNAFGRGGSGRFKLSLLMLKKTLEKFDANVTSGAQLRKLVG